MANELFGDYSVNDDFAAKTRKVQELLKNPEYVEKLNAFLIYDFTVDGQRTYLGWEIGAMQEAEAIIRQTEPKFDRDDARVELVQGLDESTNHFTREASFRLKGSPAGSMVDNCEGYREILGWGSEILPKLIENLVAGAIYVEFKLPFESYQMDITVNGQGLLQDTYFIDVQFRPIPKNVILGK